MNTILRFTLGAVALAACTVASADVTFFENDNFGGRQFTAHDPIADLGRIGFNDRASSVVVTGRPWEVCDDVGFGGRCFVLRPGNYPALSAMNLNNRISSARAADLDRAYGDDRYAPPPLPGQVTFYEGPGFHGRSFNTQGDIPNLQRYGFNDRASSVVVYGDLWEVCDDAGYNGRCVVLRPGNYPDLGAMGLSERISSVRLLPPDVPVADGRWAPPGPPPYDARPRPQEQLFQAQVLSSHAVFGTPSQHCWVEQEQVRDNRNQVGGAVIGGLLGGILGHQIARGDGAVALGAVGGAVVGGAIGNSQGNTRTEDVRHCAPAQVQGPPQYWDTVYTFRGVEHHLQTTAPPGATVTVNGYGEPRQ